MKHALVLPDGTGIRKFLGTRFLDLALGHGPVVVWHALRPGARALDEWGTERPGATLGSHPSRTRSFAMMPLWRVRPVAPLPA